MPALSGDHGARVAASYGIARSTQWPEVCRAHLAKQPACVACSRPGARVEVHHVVPFHFCVCLRRASCCSGATAHVELANTALDASDGCAEERGGVSRRATSRAQNG